MLGHSVSYYLSEEWSKTPLYAEKLIPLLDQMLSVGSPYADKLALAYYDIMNKYKNPEDMTNESIRCYVKDHGYDYILNLLSLSSDSLTTLLFLLPLIHYLKGSRKGLETVLGLLQVDDKTINTTVTAWYEETPVAEEDTFTIDTDINLATIDSDFFTKFDVFVRKYVYPTLAGLSVSYAVLGTQTILPVVQTQIVVRLCSNDMDN
jgi:hypothetical protein